MPHCVILFTPNMKAKTDMSHLCRALADEMLGILDENGKQVFPTGGTRVLSFPAAHYAVADGRGDYGFIYINVRMSSGRSDAVKKTAGDRLLDCAKNHLNSVFAKDLIGLTLQIDESPGQVYDGKHSNLHPLFNK
ncbi:MAG: 5-carboxymethyl-2-hydroxymuconate isomerase [Burkholderiaceae bacterium]|nr:5-carboxymethyl-2-hydroxymuconate isomerase [Burkholderiaceae bacterium]